MTHDIDHALTFALAGKLFLVGNNIFAIVEVQHGGNFTAFEVEIDADYHIVGRVRDGEVRIENWDLDVLHDKSPFMVPIAENTIDLRIDAKVEPELLAAMRSEARRAR